MARPKKLKLAKSKREIVKLLKLSKKLGTNLQKAFNFLITEESALNKKTKVEKKKPGRRGRPAGKAKRGRKAKAVKAGKKTKAKKVKGKTGLRGIRVGVRPWTPEQMAEMKHLLNEGLSVKEVAAKMGRSEATVRVRLYKAGVSVRAINAKHNSQKVEAKASTT